MSSLLAQVVEVAQTLPEEQLKEALGFITSLKSKTCHKSSSQPPSGLELLEFLRQEGLIEGFPDLEAEDEPELDPIPYTGKPLSEIIIEERGPK
jgi:hypothetical protein